LGSLTPEALPAEGAIEVLAALQARVWPAIETLKELHPPEANLVLVSHELPIRVAVCSALSMPLADAGRFQLLPGSLSAIEFRGTRTILAKLNESCYLE
jgi:broad specificity phosphatase PhoE